MYESAKGSGQAEELTVCGNGGSDRLPLSATACVDPRSKDVELERVSLR